VNYHDKILSATTEWSGKQLQQKMAAVFGNEFAAVTIRKEGECKSGFTYEVVWDSMGDKNQLELENVAVSGISVQAKTSTLNDGGLLVPLISSSLLAKPRNFVPQIHIFVKDVLADCHGICGYDWMAKKTMTIDHILKLSETEYELTGTKFTDSTHILVGGISAEKTEVRSDKIIFVLPQISGKVTVQAFNTNTGFSSGSFSITVPSTLSSISPEFVGFGGAEVLRVNGAGFNSRTTIKINNKECVITLVTYDMIGCEVPVNTVGVYPITINDMDTDITIEYKFGVSGFITGTDNKESSVSGGGKFILAGTFFGDSGELYVGDALADVISWSNDEIHAIYPPNKIGIYSVRVKNEKGFSENASMVTYRLEVHSISPKVSSIAGGVTATITGFGFVNGQTSVIIGESECQITSVEDNVILCVSESAVKESDQLIFSAFE
jgi:hypothetical protein